MHVHVLAVAEYNLVAVSQVKQESLVNPSHVRQE